MSLNSHSVAAEPRTAISKDVESKWVISADAAVSLIVRLDSDAAIRDERGGCGADCADGQRVRFCVPSKQIGILMIFYF